MKIDKTISDLRILKRATIKSLKAELSINGITKEAIDMDNCRECISDIISKLKLIRKLNANRTIKT